ncbi:MAG: hypothetical protein HN904_13830 [Victivallales bacterium]|nr:hypothetical protein [Victivallales bacterium]
MKCFGVALAMVFGLGASAAEPTNVLGNGGFEWEDWEWTSIWGHTGHRAVKDVSRSGARSMLFTRQGAIRSQRYRYRGGPIEIEGWYRLRDVEVGKQPYYRFWVTLSFYDKDGKRMRHWDVAGADGTCDWTKFERAIKKAPAGVAYIELVVALHNCTGTAWVDDVQLRVDGELAQPVWRYPGIPYYTGRILPDPKEATYGKTLPLYDAKAKLLVLETVLGDHPCRGAVFGARQIDFRLAKCERYVRSQPPKAELVRPVRVVLGRPGDAHLVRAAEELGIELPALADQEHLVRTMVRPEGVHILAAGGDDKGVVYAAASLVQLIGLEAGQVVLRTVDLRDRPDTLLRASSDYMPLPDRSLARLAMLKMSAYAVQHRSWWQMVGPEDIAAPSPRESYEVRLNRMRGFVNRTGAIDLMMLVHIYVAGGRPKGETAPVFDIANDAQVDDLARRLRWLYGQGVRIQMVCVDDYTDRRDQEYVCKTKAEEARFGSVGRAHGMLMKRLWDTLAPTCPELKLSLVAAPYSLQHLDGIVTKTSGESYLRDMAEAMPDEVAVVFTGARIVSPTITRQDWQTYAKLIPGQPLYLWDNCQADAPIPSYKVNFYPEIAEDSAWSLMYQNSHFMGWPSTLAAAITANDCMWDLKDYEEPKVHPDACRKAFGPVDYADVVTVNEGFHAGRRLMTAAVPNTKRLGEIVGRVYPALERLEAAGLPGSVPRRDLSRVSVTQDAVQRLEAIPAIHVPKIAKAPVLDGLLDEPAWGKAVQLGAFRPVAWTPEKPDPGKQQPAACRVMMTEDALYVAAEMRHVGTALKLHEHVGKPDANIFFNSDTLELFLSTNAGAKGYVHLAVDHTNSRFDERRPDGGPNWNGKWETAVHKGNDIWTVEVRIPFSTLGATPKAGTVWRANVCRAFGQKGELSCWSPIYGKFHNPPFFGRLTFD